MEKLLEISEISRIALLFLNGDDFENVLLDQIGPTDYDFNKFNGLKKVLLAVPMIDPSWTVDAILWQPYACNRRVGMPLVVGTSLPQQGCKRCYLNQEIFSVLQGGAPCRKDWREGLWSHYEALRNSDDEIVGVLELQVGLKDKKDVSCMDMFVPPFTLEEDDDE